MDSAWADAQHSWPALSGVDGICPSGDSKGQKLIDRGGPMLAQTATKFASDAEVPRVVVMELSLIHI